MIDLNKLPHDLSELSHDVTSEALLVDGVYYVQLVCCTQPDPRRDIYR